MSFCLRFVVAALILTTTMAFAENQHGLFMVVKGDVKVTSVGKAPFPVKVGSKILVGDTVTTGPDSRAKIVMADRNVINVSPDTRMQITKYTNDATNGTKNVEIKLDQGKVRNNVEQSYDGDKSKFILKTPTAVAGVRGTQFVTSFNSVTQQTQVVTMKGQVAFGSVLNGRLVGSSVVVNKGQMTTASPGAPPEPPKILPKNELKQIDKDSTAANKTKGDTIADGSGKNTPEGGREGKLREPANAMGDGSMVTREDIATFKPPEIPTDGFKKPDAPPLPPPPPPQAPPPPRTYIGKSKVIIIPL